MFFSPCRTVMQLQSQPVCVVLLILTSISLFFPWHVFSTFGNLAGVHSGYICHYSHFLEAFSRCSPPPQTSVLLHSGCKKEGFRWSSSNAALCRTWEGLVQAVSHRWPEEERANWPGKCRSVLERVGREKNQLPRLVPVVERKASSHMPASQTQESKLASH